MTTRTRRPPAMTGTQLQATVLDLCKVLHLRTAHFRPGMSKAGVWMTAVAGDGKGWPDLFILGPDRPMWREIKRQTNDPITVEQAVWLGALVAAGLDADVWRPADLASGRITAELEALAYPHRRITP